ncbi:HAMP domain-containing histidine kinase [Bacillus sp. Bva_UNVM-123]|uniref:sensor histidine kinase n=1 Tax=Bacillus sp. Bva_UNVM-123 TaxID=2829798 RepID=UPI00391F2C8C
MRSLYAKFAVSTILIMLVSGLISFLLSNYYYQNTLKKENDKKIVNMALEVADFIHAHDEINFNEYFEHIGSIGYQIYVENEYGFKQYYGAEYRKHNLPKESVHKVLKGEIYHGIGEFPHKTFVTGFFANELRNTVGVPFKIQGEPYALFIRPDIKLLFSEMHVLFGWLVVGIIAFSIVFVLISTKYLVQPISRLKKATALIADGDFGIKLKTNRHDEIGELTSSFNTMARKLENVDDMRKEFISNISHDIQSPLSNIKGYMRLLKNSHLTDEDRQYIGVVDAEVNRLSNLTKQLLLLSSIDSKKGMMETKSFNISEQIKSLVRQYQWSLSEKGIMMSYSLPEAFIEGDPSLLHSVWDNLLTNAIKYNIENGEIEITINETELEFIITFKDTGIGMDKDVLERIYDRFYREDTSRTRIIEGTGLGLSIVESIIAIHNGRIEATSNKGAGTIFTVRLPKKRNEKSAE